MHGESRALSMSSRFSEVAWRALQRCLLYDEGKAEISDVTSVGHLGPVFQGLGGDLDLKMVKNLSPHGHRESAHVRFNSLFGKRIHGHIYIARLCEAYIVDHLVDIDPRRWPSLVYDSCNIYALILSSFSLFQCGRPDSDKVKIIQLYEVICNRRSGEKQRI